MIKKSFSLFIFVLLFILPLSLFGDSLPTKARVIFVADGDTVQLDTGQFVRLLGIDTPEKRQEYYAKAKDFCRKKVLGKTVFLEYGPEKKDRYGRLLAYVFVMEKGKKLFVNEALLHEGLAHTYFFDKQESYQEEFLLAQRKAILLRIGLWRLKLVETEEIYISSDNSNVFHRPRCPWAQNIKTKNVRLFFSKKEAYMEGLSPCRRCQP